MRKYKIAFIGLVFLLLLFGCKQSGKFIKADIRGKIYSFEVADTTEDRLKGLMFRRELSESSGMIFIFDEMEYLRFYMKNTYIPLDIAFMDSSFRIVDIQPMDPLDEKGIISKEPAQFALEVNRGFFKKAEVKVGQRIKLIFPRSRSRCAAEGLNQARLSEYTRPEISFVSRVE